MSWRCKSIDGVKVISGIFGVKCAAMGRFRRPMLGCKINLESQSIYIYIYICKRWWRLVFGDRIINPLGVQSRLILSFLVQIVCLHISLFWYVLCGL